MRLRCLLLLATLLATTLGACRIGGVEPLPISGVVPEVVAVWPVAIGAVPPESAVWFAGLSSALGRRGYRVLTPGITRELLGGLDLALNVTNTDIGRALRADALLRLEVREFEAEGSTALQHAQWDLVWRLVSTRGHGVQWSYHHHGSYQQTARGTYDPGRSLDVHHAPPEIVPIGGRGPRGFRDAAELLAQLHNSAMERLPKKKE